MGPDRGTAARAPAALRLRRARFEDVPGVLRLIERAVERGCRNHYNPAQRRAVFLGYAQSLFIEVLERFDTVVAEAGPKARPVAMAQLDPVEQRLRALFVDDEAQGAGVGHWLLEHVAERARLRGCTRLHGAMSLNAVPFYTSAGFYRCAGAHRLQSAGIYVPVLPMERTLRRLPVSDS